MSSSSSSSSAAAAAALHASPVKGLPDAAKDKIAEILRRTREITSRKIGSPTRTKSKSRLGGDGGGSSSSAAAAAAAAAARKRKSEQEEDAELLREEDAGDSRRFTRLTVQPPNVTGGTLRDYQIEGLNWLVSLYHNNLSGILADEMGLGKTVQSISILAYLQQFEKVAGPHIVVVPLSTLGNWIREFNHWCPSIRVLRFYGSKEERAVLAQEELVDGNFDVVVTSYETAIIERSKLNKFAWKYMIVDEAHRLKNEASKLSKVLRMFDSEYRLLLTGTPLQNNLHELWALLNFLLPEVFTNSEEFDAIFQVDAAREDAKSSILQQLHQILRPFMLRRLKTDVETRLLPKVETLVFVGMSKKQKELYRGILSRDPEILMGVSKEKRKLQNILMQLRKCANHPYLFDGVEDMTLSLADQEHLIQNSGKLAVLDKLLPKLQQEGSRVLIFSQMTRMLDILEDYSLYRGYKYCRIDGNTGTPERESAMEVFNEPNSEKFLFLLSTRAGGLGINLATADIVILFDSDWNPQMDLQAQDRAHRIGQKKQVRVYRMVTEKTVEEKIIERAEIKLRLDALVIQQGRLASASNRLNQEDMQAMIRYGADQIFRSSDSTVTDEDIDIILNRGAAKTAEMNAKLKEHAGMFNLSLTDADASASSMYTMDGVDYSAKSLLAQGNDEDSSALSAEMANLSSAMDQHMLQSRRERRPAKSYNVNQYYRQALQVAKFKSLVTKPMKEPRMRDFQFFDATRIRELCNKEKRFFLRWRHSAKPPRTHGLKEEEREERDRLLKEGFGDWNTKHFQAYTGACGRYGRNNIDDIANNVKGKSPDDVRRYHAVFWARYKEVHGYQRILRSIENGEKRLKRHAELTRNVKMIMSPYESYEEALHKLHIRYNTANKTRGFTHAEDCYLLYIAYEMGYGDWERYRERISEEESLRFDYFLRSRTPLEIKRRVDSILTLIVKDKKRKGEMESLARQLEEREAKRHKAATPSAGEEDAKAKVVKKDDEGDVEMV